jgi:hypothetical protein
MSRNAHGLKSFLGMQTAAVIQVLFVSHLADDSILLRDSPGQQMLPGHFQTQNSGECGMSFLQNSFGRSH